MAENIKTDRFNSFLVLFSALFVLSLLSACGAPRSIDGRKDLALEIAQSGFMNKEIIDGRIFPLMSYQRFTNPTSGEANVYIEGDGLAYLNSRLPSPDPTPRNPLALRLAAADDGDNVLYLARPCQFVFPDKRPQPCESRYWTTHRYAPEIIDHYEDVLNMIAKRHNIQQFNLIGYSGGGVIASLLAAKRFDIKTLRTVASNLDVDAFTRYHDVSPLTGSLDSAAIAPKLTNFPQCHYLGAKDEVIPKSVVQSFLKKQRASLNYVTDRLVIFTELDHSSDEWAQKWPKILAYGLSPQNTCPRQLY
jgi:hypothetical protein